MNSPKGEAEGDAYLFQLDQTRARRGASTRQHGAALTSDCFRASYPLRSRGTRNTQIAELDPNIFATWKSAVRVRSPPQKVQVRSLRSRNITSLGNQSGPDS